jgi:8-amino-7-oxononanoate synthase
LKPLEEYEASLASSLAALSGRGLLRRLRPASGIDLVSNDYLGLASDPRLAARVAEALVSLPTGAGASRLLGGDREIFSGLESRLAAFSGSPAALLFSSGYLANLGVLGALLGKDDLVVSDRLNHASLIDGIRLSGARTIVYPHRDLDAVAAALETPRKGRAFVVTESVFSMDGDRAPLKEIVEIAERGDALVIVDEAHATGLFGARGAGLVEELGLRDRILATVHTGGKALGAAGAWVAGSSLLCEELLNKARTFVFTTAPILALPVALGAALDILREEGWRAREVHRKAALLRSALREGGCATTGDTPIVPIRVGAPEPALALEAGLREAGFDARAVRPPTVPPGTCRIRVSVRLPVGDLDLQRFGAEVCRILGAQAA